jgi:hypothetical protein
MPRCVLFDLGNVLIDFDHRIVGRELARFATRAHPVDAGAIHDYIFGDAGAASPNAGIDRGGLSLASQHADVAARFSLAVSLDESGRAWSSIFADELNQPVVDRLLDLASRLSAPPPLAAGGSLGHNACARSGQACFSPP